MNEQQQQRMTAVGTQDKELNDLLDFSAVRESGLGVWDQDIDCWTGRVGERERAAEWGGTGPLHIQYNDSKTVKLFSLFSIH